MPDTVRHYSNYAEKGELACRGEDDRDPRVEEQSLRGICGSCLILKTYSMAQHFQFQPFQWPPSQQQAALHSLTSRPGRPDFTQPACPCCKARPKLIQKGWLCKDELRETSQYGGGVSGYFALLKLYSFSLFIILGMFSIYHIYLIQWACNTFRDQACLRAFGVWVIGQSDLTNILLRNGIDVYYFKALQLVLFLWLSVANVLSLPVIRELRSRCKFQRNDEQTGVLVKHLKEGMQIQQVKDFVKLKHPQSQIKEVFFLQPLHKLTSLYTLMTSLYFQLLHALTHAQPHLKLHSRLSQTHRQLKQEMQKLDQHSRAIVTLKNEIAAEKGKGIVDELKALYKHLVKGEEFQIQIQKLPGVQEIYWENLGQDGRYKLRARLASTLLSLGVLFVAYVLLSFPFFKANSQEINHEIPFGDKLWSIILSYVLVIFSICFRIVNNMLAELRRPNTLLNKTFFIVSSTVIFHFLFYLLIPTYFYSYQSGIQGSLKLYSISFQALNFIAFQIFVAAIDLFHCLWRSKKDKLLDANKVEASKFCQRDLNKQVQFPRFPLEFKLIVLLKSWSFVIFYSFEMPHVIVLLGLMLGTFILSDKRAIFEHYRMDGIIGSQLQERILSIYTSFFTLFMCFMFVLNNRLYWERYAALTVTFVALLFQFHFIFRAKSPQPLYERTNHTYGQAYRDFLQKLSNPELEQDIQEFVQSSDPLSLLQERERRARKISESLLFPTR